MVKAKLRLSFVALVITISLFVFLMHFNINSNDFHHSEHLQSDIGDDDINQLKQRRLKEPFPWHADDEINRDSGESTSHTELESASENPDRTDVGTRNVTVPKTCRNSIQGQTYIADDKGYICRRNEVLSTTGCCNATSGQRYACSECQEATGCCTLYEQCISCCMNPKHRDVLTSVLHEASALSNILLLSVSDHFELCSAKCRTSSRSVQHENLYINPSKKYCFKKESSLSQPPPVED